MASRAISDLHPQLQPLAESFLRRCRDQGLDPLILCTWRSAEEQEALYQLGRDKPGAIATDARPGQSAHNAMLYGSPAARAFDAMPLLAGKPVTDPEHPHWHAMGEIAEALGLRWHGRSASQPHELPHFQLPMET